MVLAREQGRHNDKVRGGWRRLFGWGTVTAAVVVTVSLASPGGLRVLAQAVGNPDLMWLDPCDFATSGGFVVGDTSRKANFGAHGGCKDGEFWGHVNFMDHATGLHVNSVEITGYGQPFDVDGERIPGARDICGLATTNRTGETLVAFRVRVIDGGEPGTSDLFGIKVVSPDAPLANGSLEFDLVTRNLSSGKGGGNVQLHEPNPSTTAPFYGDLTWGTACNGVYPPGQSGGGGID